MKGKAESLPTNHVVWANGFRSNMPDWPTTRRVAVSDRLTYLLREVRTLFLEIEQRNIDVQVIQIVRDPRWSVLFESIHDVLAFTDLGIELEGQKRENVKVDAVKPMPPPPGFEKGLK